MLQINNRALIQIWDEVDAQLSLQTYTRVRVKVAQVNTQVSAQVWDGAYFIIKAQTLLDYLK